MLTWIRNVSSVVRPGDRVIIIFIAHGTPDAELVLKSRVGTEPLTSTEVTASLSTLPCDIRFLIVNEACYCGSWSTIATDIGDRRGFLVERASTHPGERSCNCRSASGKCRCSLFTTAWVEELTTYPEGRITQHYARIKEEMQHAAPDQDICTSHASPSSRCLWSYNISHFVVTPAIAQAIANIMSDQARHEFFLKARSKARTFGAKLRRTPSTGPGHANDASDIVDMQLVPIQVYLNRLGRTAAESSRSALATLCQCVLDGRGGDELKTRVLRTIAWQDIQMTRVGTLLEHLFQAGLISAPVDAHTAEKAITNPHEFAFGLMGRFRRTEINKLCFPRTEDGYLTIYFDDAFLWLVYVLAREQLLRPSKFNLDKIEAAVLKFLRRSPADVTGIPCSW